MATTIVDQPNQLDQAVNAAKNGDYIEVHTDQMTTQHDWRTTSPKHVILQIQPGRRVGRRIVWHSDAMIECDGLVPFIGGVLDGAGSVDPSQTIDCPNMRFYRLQITNGHAHIGINAVIWNSEKGNNFSMEQCYVYGIGRVGTSKTDPQFTGGDQPVQRTDGKWVSNHDHGFYASGVTGCKIYDNVFEDCADRAAQFRVGASFSEFKRNLVCYNGMGVMYGEQATSILVEDNVLLENLCPSRNLLEEYKCGAGNKAINNQYYSTSGHEINAPSVEMQGNVRKDPKYDRKTHILHDADGRGPIICQPTTLVDLGVRIYKRTAKTISITWTPIKESKGYEFYYVLPGETIPSYVSHTKNPNLSVTRFAIHPAGTRLIVQAIGVPASGEVSV